MNRLAVDSGPTACGWAVEHGGRVVHWGTRNFLDGLGRRLEWEIDAAEGFARWLTHMVGKYQAGAVVIEVPFAARRSPTICWQHWSLISAGLLCRRWKDWPVDYRPVSGSVAKRYLTGNARAKPAEMIAAARRAGFEVRDDHQADAVAMLLMSSES